MVDKFIVVYDNEGYFECLLNNTNKIDVDFDMFFNQVKKDDYKLFEAIDKYETYNEGIEFLIWMDIDIKPFLNNYLIQLEKDNGGTLKDLVWIKEGDEWTVKL